MINSTQSIKTADKARSALDEAQLDLVAGGRMKLITAVPPPVPSGTGPGPSIGEWHNLPRPLWP
jgi:hypothetical protein